MSKSFDDSVHADFTTAAKSDSKSISAALNCLNQLSSFLSLEQLDGTTSHLSCAYHNLSTENSFGLITAWQPQLSKSDNDNRAASLLSNLKAQGMKSIQILAHRCQSPEVDHNPVRAFILLNLKSDTERQKEKLLRLCRTYQQLAIASYEHREIRVFKPNGEVVKGFNLKTLEARHLKRILSALVDLKLEWSESGYLDANPTSLCAWQYHSAGLQSDVPIHLRHRVWTKVPHLIRERPYRVAYK